MSEFPDSEAPNAGAGSGVAVMTDMFSPRERETLRYGPYGIVKAHIDGRRYRAVVMYYGDRAGAMERLRRTGRMYPQVFWATTEGWTKAARAECREWIMRLEQAGGRSS